MPEGESIEEILLESEDRMQKSVDSLLRDLAAIRSTRAAPAMVENIMVDYYGTPTPLRSLAGISIPEPRMILITPYDKGAKQEIEKAIQKSDLGIQPQSDGNVIRIVMPELSKERRLELVKQVKARLEESKVSIRNVRRDANEALKKITGKGHSEDEVKTATEEIQKITNDCTAKADAAADKKEQSIMTV